MAVTSTAGMRRRMGRRWQQLHYAAYVVAALGVWHYWWQVKKGPDDAIYYAAILAVLLGVRIYFRWRQKKGSDPYLKKGLTPAETHTSDVR